LKVRIICKEENYKKYKTMLEKSGFEISRDATILFKEEDFIQDSFIGELNGEFEIIHYSKIVFIESFGRNIVLNTITEKFIIKEKLYEVEEILSDKEFIRVNKSMIVSKNGIKRIKPTFNGRIDLLMKNNEKITVSRNYNKRFRNFIGF
jgi:DNA-binding LytR/AlgR family response regulator